MAYLWCTWGEDKARAEDTAARLLREYGGLAVEVYGRDKDGRPVLSMVAVTRANRDEVTA
jgi:hypothetical protein